MGAQLTSTTLIPQATLRPRQTQRQTPPIKQMGSSPRLENLIQQLRLYRSPPLGDEDDAEGEADDKQATSDNGMASASETFRPKRAAVLVCLFEDQLGQLRVILTKRSSNLSTHSGEVALPGGKAEEGDADDKETALREAHEEIGLDPSLVTVVAVLEPFMSKHLLRVVPVIGVLTSRKPFTPVANTDEVETVFDAPLEMFLKDENRKSEERERMGNKFLIHYFDFETEKGRLVIWGFTARILIRAASVVYQRPPSFPEGKPKFKVPRIATKSTP